MHLRRVGPVAVVVLLTVSAAACGKSSNTAHAASTTTAVPSSAAASSNDAGTVDANSASIAQITSALEAHGVTNASRWAREVEEYRPYSTSDTSFSKLRQNLAKYNPGADTIDKIVASLHL